MRRGKSPVLGAGLEAKTDLGLRRRDLSGEAEEDDEVEVDIDVANNF